MRINLSSNIRADHDELRRLIRFGWQGSPTRDVEVHVKAAWDREPQPMVRTTTRPADESGWGRREMLDPYGVPCYVEWYRRSGPPRRVQSPWFSGRAYDGVPDIASVGHRTRYLVTLKMPADPTLLPADHYPRKHQDHRAKSMPVIEITCWQDALVCVAAHEAFHIRQYVKGWSCSEVGAEIQARKMVNRFRRGLRG